MTVTIGAFSCTHLTAQPFGYEGDARQGLTSRFWSISGLLTKTQWTALLSVYDTWRDARIQDQDTALSGAIGTTVSLTADGFGQSWSSVACWFVSAPAGEQLGAYVQASFTLVDATQALAVLLREQEKGRQSEEASRPAYGTLTLGSCTLTLIEEPVGYQDAPNLQLTAGGRHYVQGPLAATKLRKVVGTTTSAGWSALQTWYEAIVQTTPAAGTYWPISPPEATGEVIIDGGAKATRYTVNLTQALVR
jgi:hypothetical protein